METFSNKEGHKSQPKSALNPDPVCASRFLFNAILPSAFLLYCHFFLLPLFLLHSFYCRSVYCHSFYCHSFYCHSSYCHSVYCHSFYCRSVYCHSFYCRSFYCRSFCCFLPTIILSSTVFPTVILFDASLSIVILSTVIFASTQALRCTDCPRPLPFSAPSSFSSVPLSLFLSARDDFFFFFKVPWSKLITLNLSLAYCHHMMKHDTALKNANKHGARIFLFFMGGFSSVKCHTRYVKIAERCN